MIKLYRIRFKNGHRAKVVATSLNNALKALGKATHEIDQAPDSIEIREDFGWVVEKSWTSEPASEAPKDRGSKPPPSYL